MDGEVYDTQGQGEHAWQEQRLAEYDVVALDMCSLVGNGNPNPPIHKSRWFRNIYTQAVGFLPECNAPSEIDEPYFPEQAECTPLVDDNSSSPPSDTDPLETSSASLIHSGMLAFSSSFVALFAVIGW